MEGIEHQSDGGMPGSPHDLPRVAVVVDVATPGESLEGDAHPAIGRPLPELMKVGRGPVDASKRFGRDVAADHQQIASELLHDIELALGPREDLGPLRLGHALEVAEGLEGDRLET